MSRISNKQSKQVKLFFGPMMLNLPILLKLLLIANKDMNDLTQQLKRAKELQRIINPDASWVIQNKHRLMSQISQVAIPFCVDRKRDTLFQSKIISVLGIVQTACKVFMPRNYISSVRSVMALVLALLLTTSGWVASAYAEPGDVLWTAKEAWNSVVEQSQLAVTPEEKEAPLRLEFATKQAHVLKQVIEKDGVEPKKQESLIKKNSEELGKKLIVADESLKKASVETASEFVKDVSLKTQEISDVLKQSVQKVNDTNKQSGNLNTELIDGLDKAVIEAQKTGLGMVETVLQKKTEGQVAISEEEKNIIKNHIDVVVEDMKTITQKAKTQTDQLITIMDIGDGSSTSTSASSSIEVAVTSSVPIVLVASTTSAMTKEVLQDVVKQVDKTTITLDTQTTVSDKIVAGDMLAAIQTVRQLNETVAQTVHAVEEVGKEILPELKNSGPVIDTGVMASTTATVPSVPMVSTTTKVDASIVEKKIN